MLEFLKTQRIKETTSNKQWCCVDECSNTNSMQNVHHTQKVHGSSSAMKALQANQ